MPADDQRERSLISRIAAHSSWAMTDDRRARTAPGRRAFFDTFERLVDPEGSLPPSERARRAESARKAHFLAMARRSADTRRRKAAADDLRNLADAIDPCDGAA
jgi:hypothetical protein